MAKSKNILKNNMDIIICRHCHKRITSPALVGLTLVCPYCKKSVNGQYYHQLTPDPTKKLPSKKKTA
jgi:uncharacterized CHY-type Zn-finger protein